ncbi:ribosomal protein S7, partial [Acaromyces ingoldii]
YTPEALAQRTDPLLEAFVNNLMRDGKKAQATSHICDMLDHLAQAFHADPLPALHAAVEAASPLVRMQTRKGGGKNVQVPVALRAEQSRRKGIVAILDASKKRNDRKLATRLAREVIAVLEGTSSTLAKKEEAHKVAMLNRSNASVRI